MQQQMNELDLAKIRSDHNQDNYEHFFAIDSLDELLDVAAINIKGESVTPKRESTD